MKLPARELIDDKEVAGLDEDRLGHDGVAQQLAELVCSIPTPSNVALYGPWGSGKSGIGNLLAMKLKTESGVRFARFDAFKYAENPLRRNFVSVVATALGVKDARFHDDLYRGRTTTDFAVPMRKLFSLLWIFALVVLVAVIVSSTAISIVASVQGKDVFAELLRIGTATLPATLVPASLLTAVIALVGKTFTSEKRVERAESDEEFEKLLSDLVEKSGATRVVIFVDELDRCSSDEVVETLNAVRTFLGVSRCVFVVAADQQVLERALTDSLSQPTPVDTLNPYYSAGSAYLDKVFQYQVVVPPLMPQSIINFVVALLKGRPGVWQQIDVPVVASILIPSHVRSPRRVKNLLNAFVLSFRLAQSRVETGQLDVDVVKSVDELARIVCLRVEFPLFARDLVMDPALSDYVRELAEPNATPASIWEEYPYVGDATRRVAEEYASATRPVDRLLVEEEDLSSSQVQAVQGQQLLDYLRRTRSVAGPTKALIHLQNTGSVFGLPSTVAEQLERDAQNASLAAVSRTFEGLDAGSRSAAIQLLVQQGRAAVGLEAPNIASAILAAVARDPGAAQPFANEISMVVGTALGDNSEDLSNATAVGAWEIAMAGSRPEADSLGRLVLGSDFATTDDELFQRILRKGTRSVELSRTMVSDLIVHRLMVEDPEVVVDSLLQIDGDQRLVILEASRADVTEGLSGAIRDFNAARKAKEEAAKAVATTRAVARQAPASDDDELDDEVYDPTDLLSAMDRLLGALDPSDASASVALRTILEVRKQETRQVAQKHVGSIIIQDSEIAALILEQAIHRVPTLWPLWLTSWPAETFASDTRCALAIAALARNLWQRQLSSSEALEAEDLLRVGVSVARLLDNTDEEVRAGVVEAIDLDEAPTDDDTVAAHRYRVAMAGVLARAGMIRPEDLAVKRANAVALSLGEDLDEAEPESVLAEWVLEEVASLLSRSNADLPMSAWSSLVAAGADETWLSGPDEARLHVRLLERPEGDVSDVPDVTPATVLSSRAALSEDAFLDLQERWLRGTGAPFNEVLEVIQPDITTGPSSLLSAVSDWRARLTTTDQYTLLESLISDDGAAVQSPQVLRAAGLNDLDEASVASLLVDRFRRSTTNENRRSVLQIAYLASFGGHAARRRVLLEIIVPMLKLNASAADIAVSFAVRLGKPLPPGSRKPLGDGIVAAAARFPGLDKRAKEALRKLGYSSKRKGLFGLSSEVDTSG
ncbi:P-loop NTPase fold protein [Microbacterium algeriense]|uniref:P-loop NTPase fold protein n=1 Tax=Microbacterium algeriense TaxID=2615184 RepID=UPI0029BF8966|nr:P-loop NTPase fold protein [Microbacterium algeriense]MDX2399508.1 KAP family NTPase [Microbacterium algeriense]